MERRRFITALSSAGAVALAGCIGGTDDEENGDANGTGDGTNTGDENGGENGDETGDENGDENGNENGTENGDGNGMENGEENGDENGTENGDENGSESDQSTAELGDPTEPLDTFIDAARDEDVDAAVATFHPKHPFHPDNFDEDSEWEFRLSAEDVTIEDVETSVVTELATAEDVRNRLANAEFILEGAGLGDVIDDGPTALVEATMTAESRGETRMLGVVTAHDGEWRLLWQGRPAGSEQQAPALETRVVDEVTFDTEQNTARVQFVESPVADSVTVESTGPDDDDGAVVTENSTDTPGAVDYLDVSVDPDGDEVRVRATLDGESRLVHRERYPPSERIVDDIVYNTDVAEDDPFGARARINLNDVDVEGELMAESTKAEGEITLDSITGITFVKLGIDGDGDEIVVRATIDGETEEIHRERYHP